MSVIDIHVFKSFMTNNTYHLSWIRYSNFV